VDAVPVRDEVTVRLGFEGPAIHLRLASAAPANAAATPQAPATSKGLRIDHVEKHYFGEQDEHQPVGERTMIIREAFRGLQQKQRRKYGAILGVLAFLMVGIGSYALYQHHELSQRKELAQELFYAMKSLDVGISNLEKLVMESNNAEATEELRGLQTRRKDLEEQYDRFITALEVYDPRLSEQDRLILRVARIFGECEVAMPPGFAIEVRNYIKKWQSSGRFARGIQTATVKGYTQKIVDELLARDVPQQFFYLALQESDFNPFASGPRTRYGIAKGMWQFIPETAVKYGLHVGPLLAQPGVDLRDDRQRWELATKAAARYLQDIYATDAQGSGLLVMASYNWGEGRVIRLIKGMPSNPRDRNFWQLLAKYRKEIPQETYDYVFYIVSAAVIGENPRLFGFGFDNPLARTEAK
jgi:hypothetical protein